MGYQRMGLALLEVWECQRTEVEAEASGGRSVEKRDGSEEPSGGTAVAEKSMKFRQEVILVD
jgi:hypothetical protein